MASTALAQTMTDEPAITRRAGDTTSKAACVLFVAFELPVDSVPVKRK